MTIHGRRAALAGAVGTSPQYLWQIATGWRGKRPSPEMARAIATATNGAVSLSDLRPDIWPPADGCTTERSAHVA